MRNSLKTHRPGRREPPFSVIRRTIAANEPHDWEYWEPTKEERVMDELEEAEDEFWNMLSGIGWCDDSCGCCGGDEALS